jgi:geranylgeranyl reductase family protein
MAPQTQGGYDAIIVGGGPAGAACATVCARAGLRTLVIERAVFPREKVCGDCLNPDCWPVLERLGVAQRLSTLPHVVLRTVEFISVRGRRVSLPLPESERGEITVKRSALDALLLKNAVSCGAEVIHGEPVCEMRSIASDAFEVETGAYDARRSWRGGFLVAADGRNSLVARWSGLLSDRSPPARVGLQTHVPCPPDFGPRVQMRWFADGYGGLAPVGGGELNISLVGPPSALENLKRWASAEFNLSSGQTWRTIAPLDRAAARSANDAGVFLAGDAARVVEPFTGEGIYYALRSGELAAEAILRVVREGWSRARTAADYRLRHEAMYRGRLWVNRLARAAALHPRLAEWALETARWQPGLLRFLTAKVVGA